MIAIAGCLSSPKLEESSQKIIDMTFKQRTKMTFREIWQGLKIREIRRFLTFIVISRALVPNYSNYFYYYLTDELGFSQFQYATLNIASSITLLICVYCYNLWFKETEVAIMLGVACLVAAFGNFNSLILSSGFSFGIDPKVYAYLTGPVTDSIDSAIRLLSINVVMAKLIPANIEASMFAIQTGI